MKDGEGISAAEGLASDLLRSVLSGNTKPEDALRRWPIEFNHCSTELRNAWTKLRHFADDSDLHAAEPDYLSAEISKLKASLLKLEDRARKN